MKSILAFALVLVFVGCSDSGKSKKGGGLNPENIPEKVSGKIITNLTPLSAEQKEEFSKAFMSSQDSLIAQDVLPGADDDSESIQEREDLFNNSSPEKQALWKEIESKCQLSPVKRIESGKSEDESVKSGQVVTSSSSGSINGSNCPLSYSVQDQSSTKYNKVDIDKQLIQFSYSVDSEVKQALKPETNSSEYVRGFEVKAKTTGSGEFKPNSSKNYMKMSIDAVFLTLDGSYPMNMKVESLNRYADEEGHSESMTTTEFLWKFKVVTQVYTISKNEETISTYYINSEEVSAEEYESITGASSSTSESEVSFGFKIAK